MTNERAHSLVVASSEELEREASVTICICTFRRSSVEAAVESVYRQEKIGTSHTPIIVVDNDDTPSSRHLVENTSVRLGASVTYIHAPARNISIARNAALNAVRTRWAAFIDDDEQASPNWLKELWFARNGVQAVIGQSVAVYQANTPAWAKRCDFHSNRIGRDICNAYTCNTLLDLDFVRRHGLRFREELGQTGGEDTLFFKALAGLGAKMRYCPTSIVYEEVNNDRATMNWVLKRKLRSGQTHGLMLSEFSPKRYRLLPMTAGSKAFVSFVVAVTLAPFHHSWRLWFARMAMHLGAAQYTFTNAIHTEYR